MLRNRLATATVAALLVATAGAGLAGCSGGTTAPAPTPVRSSDLTSADGGFDEHAVIGVVLAPLASTPGSGKTGMPVAPGDVETPVVGLDTRFGTALTDAGYVPAVQVADAADAARSQQTAIQAVVRAGAKVVLVQAVDPDALAAQVRTAHDAGAVVVAVGSRMPGTGESGTGSDYRIAAAADARLVARAITVVDDLQRGKKPSGA